MTYRRSSGLGLRASSISVYFAPTGLLKFCFLAKLIHFCSEGKGWRPVQVQSTTHHIQEDSEQCLMKRLFSGM